MQRKTVTFGDFPPSPLEDLDVSPRAASESPVTSARGVQVIDLGCDEEFDPYDVDLPAPRVLEHTFRQRMQSPIPKPQNMVFPNTTPIPKYFISSVFLGAAGRWPTSVLGLGSGFCEVLVSGWYRAFSHRGSD